MRKVAKMLGWICPNYIIFNFQRINGNDTTFLLLNERWVTIYWQPYTDQYFVFSHSLGYAANKKWEKRGWGKMSEAGHPITWETEFEGSLVYRDTSRTVRATQSITVSEKKSQTPSLQKMSVIETWKFGYIFDSQSVVTSLKLSRSFSFILTGKNT